MITAQKRMDPNNDSSRAGEELIRYHDEAPRIQRRRLNVDQIYNKDISKVPRQNPHYSHHVIPHATSAVSTGAQHRDASINATDLIGTASPMRRVLDDPREQWFVSRESPKQCHSCGTTSTPEWRKGPMGPRTLCNACGLLWAKLARNQRDVQEHNRPIPKKEPINNKQATRETPTHANKCALSFLLS